MPDGALPPRPAGRRCARIALKHGVVPLAHIAEGEKDSDRLIRGGCLATTAPGGAGKWNPEFARYFENFGRVLLPDNDDVGHRHMAKVARSLLSVASWVKIVQLPVENKGDDFSDWADAGGTRHALNALIAATPPLVLADLPPPAAVPRRQPARLPDRLSPYARSAIERAVKAIGTAPQGQQQKTLNTEAYGVGQLAGAGLLPEGESLTRLLNAAADMPAYDRRRPWRPAELDRWVKRSFEDGLRNPRGIPAERTGTGSRYGR